MKQKDKPEVELRINRERLKQWRGDRTYEAVATLVGVTKSMLYMIESGARPDVRIGTLGKIARAMGVEPSELLIWEKKK